MPGLDALPGPNALQHIGRLHIVAIAALGTLTFGQIFTGERLWAAVAFCAVDWFVVNLLNRTVDLQEDAVNHIPGTAWVARHRDGVLAGGVGLLAGSFVVGWFVAPAVLPFRLAYHSLGFTYNWRVFGRRLKETYGFKNVASGVGFLLTCLAYPLAASWEAGPHFAADVTWATVFLIGGFFLLFELSYEVLYDLRDLEGDRRAGVRTFPVVHGRSGAVSIIDGLLVTSSLLLLVGWGAGPVPWRAVVMLLAPLVQLVLYKRWLKRGITGVDCVTLTWLGAGMLGAWQLWVVLELPGV